ncbi:MAG: YbbR-like domain-containing protein [Bacteroidia bacterium]|nr:YbbR-like domain-containing protein [Bacteroidia bacterium]MCZ2248871.1 YbbR-like domain-containing protein [Bacteroidia bacterium]
MIKSIPEKGKVILKKYSPKRLDKRLYAFLVCLLLSALLWLVTVFSKEYTTNISYSAYFLNLPSDKILIKDLPRSITIKAKASGFSLLGIQYSAKNDTLFIDASNIRKYINNSNESEVYYLLLNHHLSAIAEQLGTNILIDKIYPDTVSFIFDYKSQKIVPVKLNLKYSFAKQYQQKGDIKIIPSQILIKGPKSVLNTIDYIETVSQQINNLESTSKHIVAIKKDGLENVDTGIKAVVAEIASEKYTEAELTIPITVKNVPFGYVAKTFPSKVNVKYNVSLDNYESINSSQFVVEANFDSTNVNGGNNRILVRLAKQPANKVSNVRVINPQVEYIIRKL